MRLAISLPLSVVAGLATGFAIFQGPPASSFPAPDAVRASAAADQPTVTPDSSGSTDAKAERLITAALHRGDQSERENEMYLAIEALSSDDFRQILGNEAAFKAMLGKMTGINYQTGRNMFSGLIQRWLELDRDAVIAWAPRALDVFEKGDPVLGRLINALSAKIPEEMLALVSSRKEANERRMIIQNAMPKLVAKDLSKARAWVASLTDANDRREAEKALRLGIVQADPLRAVELAESIEDRSDATNLLSAAAENAAKMGPGILRQLANLPMKPWMAASMIDALAARDPQLAVEVAMKSRSNDNNNTLILSTAFAALARRDRAQCMAKLEELQGQDLAAAVSAIGYNWSVEDPVAGLSWLMQRPPSERGNYHIQVTGPLNDTLRRGFSEWMTSKPAAARAWADALPAGATRDLLQAEVASRLAVRGDVAEATQVLASLGNAANPDTVKQVASVWARRDPKAAAEWAVGQDPGPVQSRALAAIVGTWANNDQQGVANWLAQFPAGDARDRSVQAFLWRQNAWTTTREERIAEFDAWFGLIDDPWQRALVARSNFWHRKARDPAAARAWLSSLQNVDPEIIRTTLRDNSD